MRVFVLRVQEVGAGGTAVARPMLPLKFFRPPAAMQQEQRLAVI